MKKIFVSFLAASLMLLGTTANAQLVPGAGYLFASETSTYNGKTSDATSFHGFYVGASYNVPLAYGLGVAPGLYLDMLLHNENEAAGSSTLGLAFNGSYRELALNLPVNLTYSLELGPVNLVAFAGPVFQCGLVSKTNLTDTIQGDILGFKFSKTIGDQVNHYDSEDPLRNRFNIYLGGGLGVQVGDIMFTVGYDHNLLDIDAIDNVKTGRNQIKAGVNIAF